MKMKKIISLVLVVMVFASMLCVNVSASGLTSDNKVTGYVTEVKGATNDSTWVRTHTGSSGTQRTSVVMKAAVDVAAGGVALIYSHDTSGSGYAAKIAHSTFKVTADAGFQIRIRNGGSNTQWMNFKSDGTVSANSAGVDKGVTWTLGTEHRIDIVADVENGVGYLYIDKKLASYSTNLQTNGKWYGYLIYGVGDWKAGNSITWKYNYGNKAVNYVLYKDTTDYKVSVEDALIDREIVAAPSSDSIFFEHNEIRDYIKSQNSASIAYADNSSATISGDYYDERVGYAQEFMRMLTGYYPEGLVKVGGDLLYISYTQKINSASRVEMRLRNAATNLNSNRLTFVPTDDGKISVGSFSNTTRVLNKNWNDEVDVKIIVDMADRKAYAIVDGTQIGGAYDYSSLLNDFQDIKLYMNGTADNQTASVTISNWSMKLYDSTKDCNGLCAELTGMPVYFSENGNTLEVVDDLFGMSVTAKGTSGVEAVTGAKIFVAVYDNSDKLVDLQLWDYADGATNDEIIFDYTGIESKVKTFCFVEQNLMPLAQVNEFNISDYLN